MLLSNVSVNCGCLGKVTSGQTLPVLSKMRPEVMRSYFSPESNPNLEQNKRDSFPCASAPPYSFVLGNNGGLLSSTTTVNGLASSISGLALGKTCDSFIAGTGNFTSSLSLITQIACSILGSGILSASLTGKVEMAASLIGSGDITGALNLIANVVATINGSGTLSGNLRGDSFMSADILPYTELSPENLANAVWEALAAAHNNPGTMGEKLNSAGGGSSPGDIADAVWDELASEHSVSGSMAQLMKKIKTLTSANL